MDTIFKKLRLLISRNDLKAVIDTLHDRIQDNNHLNYLIMQSARYYEIERAINMDIIQWENAKVEKAQIRKGLLELIDELEANEKEEQMYLPDEEEKVSGLQPEFKTTEEAEVLPKSNRPEDWKLEGLVLRFLTVFDRWYFSPLRIYKWGARQNGFSDLGQSSSRKIQAVLEKLLSEGKVKKTKSKKGNPIYKIK